MKIQTPEEIVKELLGIFKTPSLAMKSLAYTIRKLKQAKTLLEPQPELTHMEWAYLDLKSMNFGKE